MNSQGFTLLELLLVLLTMGVLLAVAIPQLALARTRASESATHGYLRHCVTAAEMTRDLLGRLPDGLNGVRCDSPLLGDAAQPEPPAVRAGSSRIAVHANGTVTTEATSVNGRRFRFDGAAFSELP